MCVCLYVRMRVCVCRCVRMRACMCARASPCVCMPACTLGRRTFWPDFWAVLWKLFLLLWFQRHCFSAGGCGAVFYTHETWRPVHLWHVPFGQRTGCEHRWLMDALWDCRVAALRTRRGSHVKRAMCTPLSLSLSLCPPVRLSVCRSLLGAYRPNPCSQLWVNMYNMHWTRAYNKDWTHCFASFASPGKM